ncbi:MAG: CusA/CzcA family heavy metal efflux RND transporter [Oceanococcaceae bacterium]
MIERIIRAALRQRGTVLLLAAVLSIAGAWATWTTPVDAIPDLSDVQVVIRTAYIGQAPQVVEQQVTYPLSTAMLSVPQAKTVRGFSFFGDSFVYILFEDGTDPYWARSRVLESLSQVSARLPAEARPALGPDATGVGWVYEYALVDRSGQHDLPALTSLQNWFLKFELQTVDGVAEVATVGGMVRQYQVVVDPDRLRAFDLPLSRLREAIREANQESGGGVIEMAEAEYMVRASGYLQSEEDLRAIPLRTDADGVVVRLEDVAAVRLGPQLRRGIAELNGEGEVVGGIIVMRHGANARATIERVRARLDQLRASLPEGVEIVTTYDRSTLIDRAIATLRTTLFEELLIVALVCAAFLLHLRSALVVVISLPIGILTAFLVMRMQGLNANIMSLGGIAIAIGAMVDGAIVMIENLHVHLARNDARRHWQRVRDAAVEVGPALFFSLAIITLSFVPVFSLQAQEGRLFAPLAFTKIYAMAAAAGLAVTLIPVLMGYLVRGKIRPEMANPLNRLMARLYGPVLATALSRPWWALGLGTLVALSAIWPASRLGSEFMPALDEGDWMYMPTTRPGIAIGKARELLQQTDKLIKSVPEVDTVFGKIGRAETATDPAPLTMIETTITFKPESEWRPGYTREDIRAEIRERVQIPGLTNAWVMPIATRIDMLATGIKTPVGIKVNGPELAVIERIGRELEQLLPTIPGTASAYAERVVGGRFIDVDIDRARAGRMGLNIAELQGIVQLAIGGMTVTETVEGRERYPVNLRYPQAWRDSPEALAALPIVTPAGRHITLGDVAAIRIEDGPPMIKTENARPSGWVYVDIADRDLGAYVRDAQARVAEAITLPPGYSLHWAGQYEYLQRARDRLAVVVPITLAIIVLLLYAAFRNAAHVVLILCTVPVALAGSLWLLWWQGFALSVAVAVGLIALAGVAVEIGVVMLSYLQQALASPDPTGAAQEPSAPSSGTAEAGAAAVQPLDPLQHAVHDGALRRLRPVLMTATATIAGLLPILWSDGTGAEVMQRIAAPMVGGMITTLLLALVVLPAGFLLLARRRAA